MPRGTRSKITVFDAEFATLWFYPDTRILHHKIHKFMPRGAYQQLLTSGLEYLEKHQASKWLSDNSENPIVSQENVRWARAVWARRAMQAGLKYLATVMPEQAMGRIQMREFIQDWKDRGLTLQILRDPDEALDWLESVDSAR